jgi:hypothetical protein
MTSRDAARRPPVVIRDCPDLPFHPSSRASLRRFPLSALSKARAVGSFHGSPKAGRAKNGVFTVVTLAETSRVSNACSLVVVSSSAQGPDLLVRLSCPASRGRPGTMAQLGPHVKDPCDPGCFSHVLYFEKELIDPTRAHRAMGSGRVPVVLSSLSVRRGGSIPPCWAAGVSFAQISVQALGAQGRVPIRSRHPSEDHVWPNIVM